MPLSWSGKDWSHAFNVKALNDLCRSCGCCHMLCFIGLLLVYFVFHFCGDLGVVCMFLGFFCFYMFSLFIKERKQVGCGER